MFVGQITIAVPTGMCIHCRHRRSHQHQQRQFLATSTANGEDPTIQNSNNINNSAHQLSQSKKFFSTISFFFFLFFIHCRENVGTSHFQVLGPRVQRMRPLVRERISF
jgi:hypothetical protein